MAKENKGTQLVESSERSTLDWEVDREERRRQAAKVGHNKVLGIVRAPEGHVFLLTESGEAVFQQEIPQHVDANPKREKGQTVKKDEVKIVAATMIVASLRDNVPHWHATLTRPTFDPQELANRGISTASTIIRGDDFSGILVAHRPFMINEAAADSEVTVTAVPEQIYIREALEERVGELALAAA